MGVSVWSALLYQRNQSMSTIFFSESENKLHVDILVPGQTERTNPFSGKRKEPKEK